MTPDAQGLAKHRAHLEDMSQVSQEADVQVWPQTVVLVLRRLNPTPSPSSANLAL